MLFYYAHTGHKIGLDRAKRGAAVVKALLEEGVEAQLLVNDFRAGVALKEYGIQEYVTIETIQDIDAIAQAGDSLIIDSNEDDHGRLIKYISDFKHVWRFAYDDEDSSIYGEILFRTECRDNTCMEAVIVDETYFETTPKEKRILFFLGDADYDKIVLDNTDFFKEIEMEMLLGHYFFVKYENDLAKLCTRLHESEEYIDLIKSSSTVITASAQTAMEAKVSGAKVIYIDLGKEVLYPIPLLKTYGIYIISGFDVNDIKKFLEHDTIDHKRKVEKLDIKKITDLYQFN